jgi:hypothetical protein
MQRDQVQPQPGIDSPLILLDGRPGDHSHRGRDAARHLSGRF